VLEVADVLAGRSEEFDEAEAGAPHGIVPRPVLLGVGNEERATDVLNVERREPARDSFSVTVVIAIAVGIESIFAEMDALEIGVVNFHFSGTEFVT